MIDRAQIFTDLTRRNALRREGGLPLLDIRTEFERQIAIEERRAWQIICDQHILLRDEIRAKILNEFASQGKAIVSAGARMVVAYLVEAEFERSLAAKGFPKPRVAARHPIVYGGDTAAGPSVV